MKISEVICCNLLCHLLFPTKFLCHLWFITNYIISSVMYAFWLVLTYDLLEDRRIDDVTIKTLFLYILILYYIKQIDSKLLCICSAIDHRWHQNVVRTKKWHTRRSRVCHWCSYHILTSSVIYYWTDAWQLGIYLLNRGMATGNLFIHYCYSITICKKTLT